ncbi:type I polyketide synthase [Actinoplanes digitatis]|uniref:Acyl transferase domain-containing protein/acyl-CoA synthetase (AMP-forming)/AMP-acid ligase II/acyl carrier protein n=2 Tax=Actinoplanes digitatis TaxID=1868 RepID=A0A7W7I2E6_9ACTN|nr:type I polyketide synthase [Actinoplanes digitatis]MBB4765018.1 acyl transferase domain-containing protein/acyl-CoA synthetase (AMP-forming)/AMP-acid ligase II/acyl carrier protein [Actinoplanes digitatis]
MDRFRDVLERRADAPFYRLLGEGEDEPRVLSGTALDRRARAIAVALRERAAVGDRALILCPPGLDYVAAFFGCLYAGVVAVPAYPPDPGLLARMLPRLLGVIEDSTPAVVLAPASAMAMSEQIAALAPGIGELPWLAVDEVDEAAASEWRRPGLRSEDLAFLQYTSGSTGRPKGVMLSHANLLANLSAIDHHMLERGGNEPSSVIWLPPYHDMGLIGGLLLPAYRGYPVTFMSPLAFLKRPARWLRAVSDFRATHSGGPNFAFDLCVSKISEQERAGLDLSAWQVAFTGAEPVRAETMERFARSFAPNGFRRSAFYPCYGMAEASLLIAGGGRTTEPPMLRVRAAALAQHRVEPAEPGDDARTLVGCGRIIPGHRLVVVAPETCTPLPGGRVGEIWVAGPSIARSFWGRPEDSAAQLAARLADGDGPFLRTGDLGFLDGEELYVTGRIKDLIIIAGKNHYPQDLEATVETTHPALRRGAGIAFSVDTGDAERLVVVQAVTVNAARLDTEAILSAIRTAVAADHGLQVHEVLLVKPGSIPKTSSGKLQRHACKEAYLAGSLRVVAGWNADVEALVPETTPSEVRLPAFAARVALEAQLLQEIAARLHVAPERLDPRRPFASYGLQSLELVGLIGDLERRLGRTLPATLAWEYPTVEALAAFLTADGADEPAPASALRVEGSDPIAIIGIGCRFPGGADGPHEYWRLLREGTDAVTEVPADRWKFQDFADDDPAAPGKTTTRWGGFLHGVDRFDPAFFGISPREASSMDPQQRLLAEVAWEALEDAGIVPEQLAGSPTGVFIGIATNDYGHLQFQRLNQIDAYTGTGNALSIAANRLSYLFDLHGPSLAIDTACSSSLVAVQQACTSIAQGDCTIALAGGVNLILSPALAINFAKAGAMALDGRCKSFDSRADGYVRAEGAGMVVLKPLSRALRDGDAVYAVIRGGAVNQDGRTNGLMAPNPRAQEAVLRTAYDRAAVTPEDVHYVEAHGTGTLLGDPIEAKALAAVVSARRDRANPCLVGSAKSNLGHLEAAAGIAGLIKVALMLRHRRIPASLHFREPNPHIAFEELALRVADADQPWPAGDGPALAGVSAFGFGGTNAHLVLEEPPPRVPSQRTTDGRTHLLAISAPTEAALRELAARHATQLAEPGAEAFVAQHCAAAAVRRTHHAERMACVGRTAAELSDTLAAFARGGERPGLMRGDRRVGRHCRVAFVFSGQGPRWWPLAADLLDQEPVFREMLERCDASLRRHVDWSLIEQLTMAPERSRLADPGVVQPATCALQIALAALWRSRGVEPAAVVGHSVGEIAAAHVSGALDLDDALLVALHRGRVIRTVIGKGKMAVVGLSFDETQTVLQRLDDGLVSIAASNGPASTVISGEVAAVEHLAVELDAEGIFCGVLESVDYASHSPQMEPLQPLLRDALAGLTPRPPALTMVSTVTGRPIGGAGPDAEYWATNLRRPVLLDRAVDTLLDDGYDAFVEISGHPMLGGVLAGKLEARGPQGTVAASLHRDQSGHVALLGELGRLYCAGYPVDWTRLYGTVPPVVRLPAYPWQRERCWLDDNDAEVAPPPRSAVEDVLWQAIEHGDLEALGTVLGLTGAAQRAALATVLPALSDWRRDSRDQDTADAWRYRVTWTPLPAPAAPSLAGTWLLVTPDSPAEDELAGGVRAALVAQGGVVVDVCAADADRAAIVAELRRSAGHGTTVRGVVSLLALDQTPLPGQPGLTRGTAQTMALAQALGDAEVGAPLWLVTRGAVSTGPADPPAHPLQALVWGLGRVVGLEHPDRWGGLIDVGGSLDAGTVERLAVALSGPQEEDQLAVRPAGLLARRLVRAAPDDSLPPTYQPHGTVLVTGGTGALGTHLARWLARRGADHLVLATRRGPAAPGAAGLEAELTALGARVTLAACDAADPDALTALLGRLDADGTPVRAVFHVAGDVSLVKPLATTTTSELAQVVSGKDAGAMNLHELLPGRLDAFVLFSSVTGVWGSGHQCAYSAANAFLDALAEHRRGLGLPATSVQWGPWAGQAHDTHQGELERRGLRLMTAGPALAALGRALSREETTILVADMDWSLFAPAYSAARARPLLYSLPEAQHALRQDGPCPITDGARPGELRRALLAVEPGRRRRELLVDRCRVEIGRVLKLDPARVDATAPFDSMGFDSLLSLELKKLLESAVEVALPATLAWRFPTIDALVPFLAERMGMALDTATVDTGPAAPVLDVETLSDTDIEALLLDRLQAIEADPT